MGGELFEYVQITGPFSEKMCRFFFKQIIIGLHYLHSQGVCHRDLKPQNILLSDDYTIKIVDFGFATPVQGREGSGFNATRVGTLGYMAPELVNTMPYQPQVVDLFAVGVILFNMLTSQIPFRVACDKDEWYRCMYAGRIDLFWQKHENDWPQGFSAEFKDLLSCMLHVNPQHRLCMADIVGHAWMKGEMATEEEVRQEFANRTAMLK